MKPVENFSVRMHGRYITIHPYLKKIRVHSPNVEGSDSVLYFTIGGFSTLLIMEIDWEGEFYSFFSKQPMEESARMRGGIPFGIGDVHSSNTFLDAIVIPEITDLMDDWLLMETEWEAERRLKKLGSKNRTTDNK
jgi:hypothetical protein